MCTGIHSRRRHPVLAAAAALLLAASGSSQAQSLKLVSLSLPADVPSGSWVSYQVTVESKNRSPRRFTQRLSVVSREGSGEESGAWVELRTIESGRSRFERGFFAPASGGRGSDPASGAARALTLARYQRLTPDGTLYEYPVGEEGAPMLDEDVSAMDLIEFTGGTASDSLAPDTLRVGRVAVPCQVQRVRRYGKQDWPGDDTTYVNRAVMTRISWRNTGIPVTGYARSVVEVSTERVPIRAPAPADSAGGTGAWGSGAPPDSAAAAAPVPQEPSHGRGQFFYRAEINLLDLGHDAVPEVTQAPEPVPEDAMPRQRRIIK